MYCKGAIIIYEETRIGFSVPACSPSREIKYGKPGGGSRKFQIITSSSMTHLREICENWWRLGVHPRQIMQNFIHTPIHKRESIAKCCWGSSSLQAGHLEITCLHWKPPRKNALKSPQKHSVKMRNCTLERILKRGKACSSSSYGLRPAKSVKYSRRSSWVRLWSNPANGQFSVLMEM